jgi:hypothetical protein
MPNIDAPRGFLPVRKIDGSPYNGEHVIAYIPSADATATFVGDVVVHNGSSGAAGLSINGMDMEGVPQVIRASTGTTGQNIFGVVVGFLPDSTSLQTRHRAASTNRVALVAMATDYVFEVQEDADTTPLAATNIGQNVSFTTTAGSAVTGQSAEELDSSAAATTATLPLKIIGLSKRVGNAFNIGGSNTDQAVFEVVFNTSLYDMNIVGV